jgi:hypothetical protein
MKARLGTKKIAGVLRAEHRSKVTAAGGYFGTAQLAADVLARSRRVEERRRPAASPSRRPSDDGEG